MGIRSLLRNAFGRSKATREETGAAPSGADKPESATIPEAREESTPAAAPEAEVPAARTAPAESPDTDPSPAPAPTTATLPAQGGPADRGDRAAETSVVREDEAVSDVDAHADAVAGAPATTEPSTTEAAPAATPAAPDPVSDLVSQAFDKPEPVTEAEPKGEAAAEAEPTVEPKAEAEPAAEVVAEPADKAVAETAVAEAENATETETETEPSAAEAAAAPEATPEPEAAPEPEAKPEEKAEPEAKAEATADTEPKADTSTATDAKAADQPEATSEAEPATAPAPQDEEAEDKSADVKAAEDKAVEDKAAAAETAEAKTADVKAAAADPATEAKPQAEDRSEGAGSLPATAPALLSLYKSAAATLDKHGLATQRAAVYLVLDRSGSMRNYYKDGTVQNLAEQALGLSAHFDDDATVPVVFFSTDIDGTADIDLTNYEGRIAELHAGLGHMGRTNYHWAINAVVEHYKKSGSTAPAFVIFQTDGAPTSKPAAEKALCEAAGLPIFWQFIGFGDPDAKGFDFLRKLDDLAVPEKRVVDNAGFFHAGRDPRSLSHDELYQQLMVEFPEWLAEARTAGIIKAS
ncbi:TerF vWA domain-containing protein [Streptomyces sp. 2112.3]|uniref:vWA domain-containing protein n=1 Tax=Streptomyces sp. 2112.3 TaxID=1881023 RepID=UPI00089C2B4B|nr:VWA domain-containing protein [Streptomyces sp. 2112.3]SEE74954.1 TerF vWA domain-containing protein [Streptomyces sp. 2112.3]